MACLSSCWYEYSWELNYPFYAAHAHSNFTQLKFLIKITICCGYPSLVHNFLLHGNLKTLDPSTLKVPQVPWTGIKKLEKEHLLFCHFYPEVKTHHFHSRSTSKNQSRTWFHLDAERDNKDRGENDKNVCLAEQPLPGVNCTTERGNTNSGGH